jgi:hypothetical protein
MMPALAQVDVEMNSVAAAAAEEDGWPLCGNPRAIGGQKQIGSKFIAQGFTDLA